MCVFFGNSVVCLQLHVDMLLEGMRGVCDKLLQKACRASYTSWRSVSAVENSVFVRLTVEDTIQRERSGQSVDK